MTTRAANEDFARTKTARELVEPLTHRLGELNEELASLRVVFARAQKTDKEDREILRRSTAAQAALLTLERQLSSSLAGQPAHITEHGRIKDIRQSIAAIRTGLNALGA